MAVVVVNLLENQNQKNLNSEKSKPISKPKK